MHAIDGGKRCDDAGPGFAQLYADVFARPLLKLAPPPLRLVASDGRARAARPRRGRGRPRQHLRVVGGTRR